MGALWSRFFESDEQRAQREAREAAHVLARARHSIVGRIEIIDAARRHTLTKLSHSHDRVHQRYLLTSVRDYDRRRRDQYALLTNVDSSLARLEDAMALVPTIGALRTGTRSAVTIDVDRVQRIVDDATQNQQDLADAYAALSDSVDVDEHVGSMTDDELDAQINALIGYDTNSSLELLSDAPPAPKSMICDDELVPLLS